MAKHDTWVKLKPGHPFESIEHLFPEGFPMRDPFPMGGGKQIMLWFMDMDRLNSFQMQEIAKIIALNFNVSVDEVFSESLKNGFAINNEWIDSMKGEAENYRRSIEVLDFLDSPDTESPEAYQQFIQQQYRDWIDGDRIPEPMPENYEDFDPRMKSPEMEQVYKQIKINKLLQEGNYSTWDVLSGKAMVEVLNQVDSEHEWALATDEDWD